MTIPDDLLAAYVDGELDAAERERVEQAIAHDPQLALRLAQERALRDRLRGAFESVLSEPIPQRLLQAATLATPAGQAKVIDLARARTDRARRDKNDRSRIISRRVAIAASLLVGVGVGLLVERLSSGGALTELRDGTLLARGALGQALNHQLASAPPRGGTVRIGLTFRAKNGSYCRTFAINASRALAGLACREQQQWQLLTLLESDNANSDGQNLRKANSALPPALLQAVTERISGEPLDAQGESNARDQGWH